MTVQHGAVGPLHIGPAELEGAQDQMLERHPGCLSRVSPAWRPAHSRPSPCQSSLLTRAT
jgi:hypothetical protein